LRVANKVLVCELHARSSERKGRRGGDTWLVTYGGYFIIARLTVIFLTFLKNTAVLPRIISVIF